MTSSTRAAVVIHQDEGVVSAGSSKPISPILLGRDRYRNVTITAFSELSRNRTALAGQTTHEVIGKSSSKVKLEPVLRRSTAVGTLGILAESYES